MATFYVSLDPVSAGQVVQQAVIDGSITGELIDAHQIQFGSELCALVLVFEKHYYRAGNRLTLTVTLDNAGGVTRVHTAAGGGGEGLFRFDWGASESFEDVVFEALQGYQTGGDRR
jgi:hypothetical protein